MGGGNFVEFSISFMGGGFSNFNYFYGGIISDIFSANSTFAGGCFYRFSSIWGFFLGVFFSCEEIFFVWRKVSVFGGLKKVLKFAGSLYVMIAIETIGNSYRYYRL